MSFKLDLYGRVIVGMYYENQYECCPPNCVEIESTYNEYVLLFETHAEINSRRKISLWVDGQVVEATSQDQEFKDRRIAEINAETYDLIKNWCKSQPEGCEEKFLFLGVENNSDLRYIEYKNKKATLILAQNQKKADEGLI